MATIFNIKVGDTLPLLQATLTDGAGNAINVSGANGVSFRMRKSDGPAHVYKAEGAADLTTDGSNGQVEFAFSAADTDTEGEFYGEFVIDWGGGDIQTIPNDDFLRIIVRDVA